MSEDAGNVRNTKFLSLYPMSLEDAIKKAMAVTPKSSSRRRQGKRSKTASK